MVDYRHTALIIVDNQIGAIESNYWGTQRSNPSYEANISILLSAFRSLQTAHIIHVFHSSLNPASPLRLGLPGIEFHVSSRPLEEELVMGKSYNSAFQDSDLGRILKDLDVWQVYFVGLSIDLCLGSTVRGASDLRIGEHQDEDGNIVKGDICLVGDATLAWAKHDGQFDAETVHGVHLESLKGEFARVLNTKEVLEKIGAHRDN